MEGAPVQLLALVATLTLATLLACIGAILCVRTPAKGTALVVHGPGPARVAFARTVVVPLVHRAEALDLSVHTLVVERRSRAGLACRDNIRADVRATFLLRVNRTAEDVLRVADSLGCARAGDPNTLAELFTDKFVEALQTVARQLEFEELTRRRDDFKDQVIERVGRDLNGFVLDDLAISSIEQTPVAMLDPNNVLDAQGIRKIAEITRQQQRLADELRRQTHG